MQKLSSPDGLTFKTKQEYVYQVLKSAIMQCELLPGKKLVISDIATQLQVSTIPVREALQLLQSEDLVNYNYHVGAIVAPITKDSIVETFTIKEGLEGVATRVALEKVTKGELGKLELQLASMDQVLKSRKYEEWSHQNESFHKSIVGMAGMPILAEMHLRVLGKWDRIRRYFFSEVLSNRHEQSQKEHYAIVHAMANGDNEKAIQFTRLHNQNALGDYMKYIGEEQCSEES